MDLNSDEDNDVIDLTNRRKARSSNAETPDITFVSTSTSTRQSSQTDNKYSANKEFKPKRYDSRPRNDNRFVPHNQQIFPQSRNLFVANISPHISAEELTNLFNRYGRIEQVSLFEGKNYGFVNYFSIKSASIAKSKLDGYRLDNRPLYINYSNGVPTRLLWIGNIQTFVSDSELKDLFLSFGRIMRIDREISRGKAFILYETIENAINAFDAMQGYNLEGWNLMINYATEVVEEKKNVIQVENKVNEKEISRNLWVGRLNYNVTKDDIDRLFNPYGDIESIRMIKGKGFAFVEFKSAECALSAMQQLDGTSLRGDRISIRFAKTETSRHLWITNLSPTITVDKIKSEFSRYGKIEQCYYKKNCNTCFLDFSDVQKAENAKKMLQGKFLEGYPLQIEFGRSHGKNYSDCLYIVFPKESNNIDVEQVKKEFKDFRVIGAEPGKYGCYLWFPSVMDAVNARDEMNGNVLGNREIKIEFVDEEKRVEKRSLSPPRSPKMELKG